APRESAFTTLSTSVPLAVRAAARMRRCLLEANSNDPEALDQSDLRCRRATAITRQGGAELGSLGLFAPIHVCHRHRGTCRAGPVLVAGTRARWCRRIWSRAARRTGHPDQAPRRRLPYRADRAHAAPGDGAVLPVNGGMTWKDKER